MRCVICNKPIDYVVNFKDLFVFRFVCKECAKNIKLKYTLIPIDNAYFIKFYYYLTDEKLGNEYKDLLIYRVLNLIKKNINKIIIFYDYDDLDFYEYLCFKEDIILINNTYVEIENLMIEK